MSKPVLKPENLRRASAAYTELYNQNGLTVWATKSGRFELKCGSTTTVANNLADVAAKVDNLSLAAFPGSGSEVVSAIKEAAAGKYCLEIRASKAGKEQVVHTLEGSLDKISDGLTGVASVNVKELIAGRRYAMQQNMYGGEYMILIPMSDAMMNLDTSYDVPELYEKQVFSKGMVLHGICPKNNEVLTVLVSEAYPNGSFKDADGRVWSADDVSIYQFAIGTAAASEEDFKEPDDALYVSEDLPSYNPVGVVKEQAPMIGNLANYDTILTASADVISDFMKTCRKVAYLDKSSLNKVTVSAVNGEGQATDGSIEWNVRLGSPSYKRVSTVTIPLVMVNGSIDLGKEFITSTGAKLPLTPEAVHAHLGTLADDDMFRHASKEINDRFPSTLKASKAMDTVFAGVVEASPIPMAEQTPIGADADKQNEVSATKKTAADDVIAPDFWIVGINETEFWSDDIKAQVDAIVTYYLYDAHEVTHLASMTGSYYLYPITTDPWPKDSLSEEERDTLFDTVLSNSDLNPDYFDERTIDNISAEHKIHIGDNGLSRPKKDDAASEAAYKEGIDALLDHYRGNPPYMPSLEKTSGVKAQKASKKTAAPSLRERQVNMLANSIVSNMAMYKEEIDKGELTAEDRALELVTGDSWEGYPKFSELNQKQVADLVRTGLTEKGFTSAQVTEVLDVLDTAFSTQGTVSVDATAAKKTAIGDSDETSRAAAYTLGVILWDVSPEMTEEAVTASFGKHGTVINFENDEGLVLFGLQVDSRKQALEAAKVADASNGTIDAITQGTWGTIAENHGYPTAYDFVGDALGGETASKKTAGDSEMNAGFALDTAPQQMIEEVAAAEGISLTDDVWATLNKDIAQMESNALSILEKQYGMICRSEGHSDDSLIGSCWPVPGKENDVIKTWETYSEDTNPGNAITLDSGEVMEGVSDFGKQLLDIQVTFFAIEGVPGLERTNSKKTVATEKENELQDDLVAVINSCVEGYTGEWDVSTDEGREGFLDIYTILEKIESVVGENPEVQEDLTALKDSCTEGASGDWDTTGEGKQGFLDMHTLALKVAKALNVNVSGAKQIEAAKEDPMKKYRDAYQDYKDAWDLNVGPVPSFSEWKDQQDPNIFASKELASKKVAATAIIFDISKMVDTFDPINGASGDMKDQGVFAANKVVWSVEDFWKEVESSTGCSKADFGVIEEGRITAAVLEDAEGNQVHDAVKEQELADAKGLFLVDYEVFIKLGDGTEPTEEVLTQMLGIGHI